ncbi:hypothetical protein SPHINGO8AM_150065 [Sphingomonas sp. 8AM]|nr:hypothetical protein SPHINGO8AM_150065 [Sphingomonas sp. 8AM]
MTANGVCVRLTPMQDRVHDRDNQK